MRFAIILVTLIVCGTLSGCGAQPDFPVSAPNMPCREHLDHESLVSSEDDTDDEDQHRRRKRRSRRLNKKRARYLSNETDSSDDDPEATGDPVRPSSANHEPELHQVRRDGQLFHVGPRMSQRSAHPMEIRKRAPTGTYTVVPPEGNGSVIPSLMSDLLATAQSQGPQYPRGSQTPGGDGTRPPPSPPPLPDFNFSILATPAMLMRSEPSTMQPLETTNPQSFGNASVRRPAPPGLFDEIMSKAAQLRKNLPG